MIMTVTMNLTMTMMIPTLGGPLGSYDPGSEPLGCPMPPKPCPPHAQILLTFNWRFKKIFGNGLVPIIIIVILYSVIEIGDSNS